MPMRRMEDSSCPASLQAILIMASVTVLHHRLTPTPVGWTSLTAVLFERLLRGVEIMVQYVDDYGAHMLVGERAT
jgi:hypothetical protein